MQSTRSVRLVTGQFWLLTTVDIEDPANVKIATRLGVHPAAGCVKWAVQRGRTLIPFSTERSREGGIPVILKW